jgi:hypothetical protein
MIMPRIKGEDHWQGDNVMPFTIGDVDPAGAFVHVLDDATLEIVLSELNTVSDFSKYLMKKERFVRSGKLISAAGEEATLQPWMRMGNMDSAYPVTGCSATLSSWGRGCLPKSRVTRVIKQRDTRIKVRMCGIN